VRFSGSTEAVELVNKNAANAAGIGVLDQLNQLNPAANCAACTSAINVINARTISGPMAGFQLDFDGGSIVLFVARIPSVNRIDPLRPTVS
jgi:hypothetical protein